jgi:predicted GNAT family acetyltransferase
MPTVTDMPDANRFEIVLDDGSVAGFVEYHRAPGRISLIHTEVFAGHEGEGLASQLIRSVLGRARADGLSVLPFCPFVRRYIASHPEYVDLVPPDRRAQFDLAAA